MADNATFYWNELMTSEVDEAKEFYQKIFGWVAEDMPMPDGKTYTVMKLDGKPVGGMMSNEDVETDDDGDDEGEESPSHWMAYVQVGDVDATIAKVEAAGGDVLQPAFDVPGVGRIAIIEDPTGAVMGIIKPVTPPPPPKA